MTYPALRFTPFHSVCLQCRQRLSRSQSSNLPSYTISRPFTRTAAFNADPPPQNPPTGSSLSRLSLDSSFEMFNSAPLHGIRNARLSYRPPPKPHHLHIFATKHNCHITLTAGNREPIISVSAGNLNFKKAARGTYDAAFQLGAFVMAKIANMGLLHEAYPGKGGPIRALEVCLRDFGPGRDAVTKIMMGQEGQELRKRVTRIMDATRLKFGGTRGKRHRRL